MTEHELRKKIYLLSTWVSPYDISDWQKEFSRTKTADLIAGLGCYLSDELADDDIRTEWKEINKAWEVIA